MTAAGACEIWIPGQTFGLPGMTSSEAIHEFSHHAAPASSTLKIVRQNPGVIVLRIVRGVDEGYWTLGEERVNATDRRLVGVEFGPAAALEFRKPRRVMAEPLAHRPARRDLDAWPPAFSLAASTLI
jgi:hypothetical protein